MKHSSVLLVIAAESFASAEYQIPKDIIARAGFSVKTASSIAISPTAKDGTIFTIDYALNEVNIDNFNGIFFIGGPGALELLDNELSYSIIMHAVSTRLPLGAISTASRILAKAGALKGKYATGWNGDGKLEEIFEQYGALYMRQNVVIDGTIITASTSHTAEEFGNQIVSMLQDNKGWG